MKKKTIIIIVAILILAAILALVVSKCGGGSGANDKPLVAGYSNFSSKFSPFFSETAYDQDVWGLTAVSLLDVDRLGAIVEKGKSGDTRSYNGHDYTYYGPADLTITTNADGTVDYDFDLRTDIKFSDGKNLTADDVIFSMYVLSDPTYDGSSTFFALPIKGMEEYRAGMASLLDLLLEAGPDNTDFSLWDEATQKAFWDGADAAGPKFAQSIVDYCINNGYAEAGSPVELCAGMWGFELKEGATVEDFWAALKEAYDGDLQSISDVENAGSSLFSMMDNYDTYTKGVKTGNSADKIEGIQKTGDYGVRVTLTEVDATAIYQLGVPIAPLHYYGDTKKYDYDKNMFGFDKGDLNGVRAKTTQPMGAGPYKFIKFENGVVSFEANKNYYLGAPKTRYVQFLESQDQDKLNGVITGTIDVTDPSYSVDTVKAISAENSNGEVTGDKITTNTVNNLGYGYLGISANAVNVGGEPGSDASKNLRKAFATVYARYRDVTVDSYYGPAASVINYPISDTSWAAPQKTDADYAIAFSKDVDGKDIYTSGMSDDEKDQAALDAALGFFEAAGYTVEGGKVTAAPEGASMEYEVWIPADGAGDHPSFMMLNLASDAMAKIGITLNVKDLANSSDLWTGISADQVPMWCAAWGASPDPDMYQVYYSGVESGKEPGGSNYMYDIADPELDELILDARTNMDQSYRKAMYKSCLDIIIDWAVEVPVYQRQNAIIFSTERVKMDSVTPDITTYYGWLKEIQNIELN
ncbi:MAG: ABC transporter substrate-binding protein [Oscillospiraceae bacterium]|nr:ABC transporter substrate-binding protein [Oscillospiraceae bacterium]